MSYTEAFWTTDPGLELPRGRSFWTEPEWVNCETLRDTFTTRDVATVFFGRSIAWLEKLFQRDPELREVMGPVLWRGMGARGTRRAYSLHNIERLAHALIERRLIDGARFINALRIVLAVAHQYGYGPQIHAIVREAARERAREA